MRICLDQVEANRRVTQTNRGHVHRWDMLSDLVGDTVIEPVTSSV
jgi:hypothetical protein